MTEKGCGNCYYSFFDERAYPCSLCIRGIERTDKWQPSKKTKADRKTEPKYDIDKGTIRCDNCSENGSYKCTKCDGEMYFKRLEDEPQTCQECEHWNDTEDGCADRHGCKTEPQTETQIKTQNSNLPFEKADERCKGCNHYKLTCDLFSEICKYEPKDEPQTEDLQDWKDRMWAEAVIASQTENK